MTDASPAASSAAAPQRPRARRVWLSTFAAALTLYALTADRGVQWQDSGWQQLRIATGDISHPAGLALAHPLQFHLGRLLISLTSFEPAFAVTLVSCLAAAIALANLAALLWLLTRSAAATAIPVAALAFSHTFWHFATHAESYALVAALLTAEWLCLARFAQTGRLGWLPLLAFCNGLGVANHLLAALATPVDAVVILRALLRRPGGAASAAPAGSALPARRSTAAIGAAAILLWILGALPYLWLIAAEIAAGGGWADTLRSATVGKYGRQVLNTQMAVRPLLLSAAFVLYNFPNLTLPLAAYGAMRGALPKLIRRVLLIELFVYTVFVVRYSIPDQYTFFVPLYAILAVFAGAGLAAACARLRAAPRRLLVTAAAITACWNPLVYPLTATLLRRGGALAGLVPQRPYTDGYWLYFVPWGVGSAHVQRLHADLRSVAGPSTFLILGTTMMKFAIQYDQRLGRLPREMDMISTASLRLYQAPAETAALLRERLARGDTIVQIPNERGAPEELVPGAVWRPSGDLYILERLPDGYNSAFGEQGEPRSAG